MAIKFQCVNEQHAIIAALRMKGLGRKTLRLGRAVICSGDWSIQATRIASQNMSHTLTPTSYDRAQLAVKGSL